MPDIFVAKDDKKSLVPSKKVAEAKKKVAKLVEGEKKSGLKERKRSRNSNPFLAFSYKPYGIDFETREPKEKIVLLLRRHPITNLSWIAIAIVMLFAPAALNVFPVLSFMPERFQFISVLGWYLITTAFILENFLSWFFNVNIVTDERIVDIDFHNLIYKEVSDANTDKIQDVTYNMGGAVRTIFNYGDVLVQTAAEVPNFEFLAVPKPAMVVKILQKMRIEEEVEKLEGRIR